jgi:transketolase
VGIAAGMALSGLRPIFYTIVNFLVYRSLEQVRNDVALQKLNVKFVGTGANDYFRMLGDSHCCGRDDVQLMELAGVKVYDPYAGGDFDEMIDDFMTDERAGYMRV